MVCTVTCPKCGRVIRPLVSNLPSSDAQCPECGGWFWISLTAWHAHAAQQNVGTEECECEYGGKTNTKDKIARVQRRGAG